MSQGYAFSWKPGESPYVIRLDGFVVRFEVVVNVPILRLGSELSSLVPLRRKDLVIEWESETATLAVEGGDPELSSQEEPDHNAGKLELDWEEEPSDDHPGPRAPGGPADRRRVAEDVNTIEHLRTHKPSNPYCAACMRAKMKHAHHRRVQQPRESVRWGDHLTMDHLVQRSGEFTTGVLGKLDAFVVLDVYSRWKRCLLVASRDHHTTLTELKHLIGRRNVRFIYFDAAPEFGSVCSELAIPI